MIKNLKKVISTLAAVAILATSASAFAVSFPDVDANASYAGAVEALTTLGVVNGDDNGKFNPENTVTRAEFAKMVVEALGAGNEAASSADTKFVDAKGHWAAGYIEVGVSKAFINGYDEKTFGPDDQVTYAQAVKMLVAAIGYETYASMQGGWPSGYLAYGSQLDIIAGVTGVANDTALTRAQCAVLIYNTLKAPICKVDGYEQNYKGEWVPKLEEMNGEGKNWQTLLTSKHDAWVVKGRVTDSVTVDAVDGDTVPFRIELAENFENEKVKAYEEEVEVEEELTTVVKGAKNITAYVGNSKAADMLFNYAEAIIQKDKDTNEYSIVSITPYGAVKTVEFAAKDIKIDETFNGVEIKVKKDNTTKTTNYDVDGAQVYVNGVEVEGGYEAAATATEDDEYTFAPIHANNTGVVTLVNATEIASTSTDDSYDYVMITYYETGVVTAVDADDEEAVIEIANISGAFDTDDITIDLEEDPDRKVTFIKDGAEISYEDVKKDDIVSIAYAWGGDWTEDDIEVIVSDKVVSGTATGKNTTKNTVTVDGTVYDYALGDEVIGLGNSYNLYLDAFGCIVKADVNATNKTLGIVVGKYPTAGEYKIKLITADGTVETYPVANETEYNKFPAAATSADNAKDAVVEYKIDANGNIKWRDTVEVDDDDEVAAGAEFTKELSMLGGYQISETATKVIALGSYFDDGKVAAMTFDQLEDEAKYDVFVTNMTDDVYGLVVITGDLAALNQKSTLAVVMAKGTATTVNDQNVEIVTVAVNGEENVDVYFEDADDIKEGDIIMYRVGTEGYVEANVEADAEEGIEAVNNYIVVRAANESVDAMYTEVFADVPSFTAAIASTVITDEDEDGTYTLAINGEEEDEEVEIYYGPVYTATENSLRIFKKQTEGVSSFTSDVKAFSIGNANVYSYNYSKLEKEGLRVSVAGLTQDMSFFKAEGESSFTWATRTAKKVNPRTAFVRVVDNVVTDVVYYRAK